MNLVGRAGEVRRCGEHPIPQSSLGDRTGQDGVKHTDPSRTQDRSFSDTRGGKQLRGWFPAVHTIAQEGGRKPTKSREEGGYPGGSVVKNKPAMQETQETQVRSLGRKDPPEEGMATHSRILAWRIAWTEESVGVRSIGSLKRHN